MTAWTGERVATALGLPPGPRGPFASVCTDTRQLRGGELFVALRGPRFDGHDFLEEAARRGAAGAVVRHGTAAMPGLAYFEVQDTLWALGALAHARRGDLDGPVVAVTGTNGKTSTKEFLAAALGTRWRVHATRANLNNEIGVPLTVLSAPPDAEALVIEAGASEPGEIGRLRDIIAPTVGVVTNVSPGHVEGFGTEADILTEKLSLLAGVPLAIVGMHPPALAAGARTHGARVVTAGLDGEATFHPDAWSLDAEGRCVLELRGARAVVPAVGRHQGENALIALAVADALGITTPAALRALEAASLPPGRCEVLITGGITVLNDTYNANPVSMEAALETAAGLRGDRPLVVVVGSMLELGAASAAAHARLADRILDVDPVLIGAVGEFVPAFARHRDVLGDRLVTAADADALGRAIAERLEGHELVLLKASRGVRLERALTYLLPDREAPCSTTS